MELPDRLTDALRRLTASVDLLEAAAERRSQADAAQADLQEELAVMQDDRGRLGVELEASMEQARKLLSANTAVAERLDHACASIRSLLDASAEAGSRAIDPQP